MLTVTGTIKLATDEDHDRALVVMAGRAARSRKDAGNIDYVFSINIEDPREIRLFEKWESKAALDAHLEMPDKAFDDFLGTVQFESVTVVRNDVSEDITMM